MELSAPPLLSVQDLRASYGGRAAVSVAALEVRRGEVVAVLGPNGAGKSTLFRILLLLQRPDSGTVRLDGAVVVPGDRAAARRMAGVFQRPYLFAGTVASNVAFGPRARGLRTAEIRQRVDASLQALGLGALSARDVRTLSGGEQQRVAVARALAADPEVLLLDEPTASLDVTAKRGFREDLERAARSRERGVLLITHDPADAFALADRIAVMEDGHIVQEGPPDALVLEPATPFVAEFTGADLLLDGIVEAIEDDLATVRLASGARVRGVVVNARVRMGQAAHASYRPEDVTLVLPEDRGTTSAINRFEATVASLVSAGGMVRARLVGDAAMIALITRRSAEALGLEQGTKVEAQLKATAVRVYRAA